MYLPTPVRTAARGAALIPTSIKGPDEIAHAHAVVPSWNGAHLLPDCLRALAAQTVPLRVTVVDNGSSDGTAELLAREFPSVQVLRLPRNAGYGRANNEAIRSVSSEFVVLVNNDVELSPDWLSRMLAAAEAQPGCGLFCGTLVFRDDPSVVNSTGIEIDFFGRARDRDFGLPLRDLRRSDGPVLAVTGGAALLRTSMLRTVGLFDPAYFAYYEDVDLSLRANASGFGSYYVRDAVARHRFGASFGRGSARQRYLLGRGHLRTVGLHEPIAKAAWLVPLTMAFRMAVKAPLELLRRRPAHAVAEVRAALSGGWSAASALVRRTRPR
jgi:N-acetylglucosaminyl-diphospho-decaprenol L-rhamnosyltransferase